VRKEEGEGREAMVPSLVSDFLAASARIRKIVPYSLRKERKKIKN
jgi:hypothetical protein